MSPGPPEPPGCRHVRPTARPPETATLEHWLTLSLDRVRERISFLKQRQREQAHGAWPT
jgi:hypothetical protein